MRYIAIILLSFISCFANLDSSSLDMLYTENVAAYLKDSKVRNGCILVSNLKTGEVKAVVEVNNYKVSYVPKMVFTSTYPAASLSKIITTVSAIQNNSKYICDEIPQVGSIHGISPKQYIPFIGIKPKTCKRTINLEYAFANSVNPAMAIIGYDIGYTNLYKTASLLGFNKGFQNTKNKSIFPKPSYKEIARHSSGYTVKVTISPYHANMIARALGSNGSLKELSFTKFKVFPDGEPILSGSNLELMKSYMRSTVEYGTAEGGFDKIFPSGHDQFEIGGKTGNLNDERGVRHTWFTGYAKDLAGDGIAVTTLILDQRRSKTTAVKASAYAVYEWFYGI